MGRDHMILDGLRMGCVGAVTACANVVAAALRGPVQRLPGWEPGRGRPSCRPWWSRCGRPSRWPLSLGDQGSHEHGGDESGPVPAAGGSDAGGLRARSWPRYSRNSERRTTSPALDGRWRGDAHQSSGAERRVLTCSSTPTTPWTGIRGGRRRSRRPAGRTSRSSSPSATPPATGVTSWSGSRSRTSASPRS